MIFLVIRPHIDFSEEKIGYIAAFTGGIASLSGFVNALIFSLQKVSTSRYTGKSFISSYNELNEDLM